MTDTEKVKAALEILDGVAEQLSDEIDVTKLYGDLRRVLEAPSDEKEAHKRALHAAAKRRYRARLAKGKA